MTGRPTPFAVMPERSFFLYLWCLHSFLFAVTEVDWGVLFIVEVLRIPNWRTSRISFWHVVRSLEWNLRPFWPQACKAVVFDAEVYLDLCIFLSFLLLFPSILVLFIYLFFYFWLASWDNVKLLFFVFAHIWWCSWTWLSTLALFVGITPGGAWGDHIRCWNLNHCPGCSHMQTKCFNFCIVCPRALVFQSFLIYTFRAINLF